MICCKGVVFNKGNNGCYLFVYFYFNFILMEKFSFGQCISFFNKVFILVGYGNMFEFLCFFVIRGKG